MASVPVIQGWAGLAVVIGVLLALVPGEMLIAAVFGVTVLIRTGSSVWLGVALFAPLVFLCWLFGEPVSLLLYAILLPCLAGITHWITTRNLPPDRQKEALLFWVARKRKHESEETSQTQ